MFIKFTPKTKNSPLILIFFTNQFRLYSSQNSIDFESIAIPLNSNKGTNTFDIYYFVIFIYYLKTGFESVLAIYFLNRVSNPNPT